MSLDTTVCCIEHNLIKFGTRSSVVFTLFLILSGEKASSQLPHIMPDYMLVFAVPILAHLPDFKDPSDMAQLMRIRSCLWYILEPLMTKNDAYCFGFYKALIEQMKNHKDAVKPEDEMTNQVSL